MNLKRGFAQTGLMAGALALFVGLAGCRSAPAPTQTAVPPTIVPTPLPTLALAATSAKDFVIADFGAVHTPVGDDANKYLIYGNIPVSKPATDVPPELAAFLGRWEGYSDAGPVKKDQKIVMVVQEITAQGGRAFGWGGTNPQYPTFVQKLRFRVVMGETPSIEWQNQLADYGIQQITTFTYDREKDLLLGWARLPDYNYTAGPLVLSRDRSFYVYKDYAQYLAGKRIHAEAYQSSDLQRYGQGYMLYLPEGYDEQPEKAWPLIFFLHGVGDRGDNVLLLAKASPFMFIREKGPLPFIIAAPLLKASDDYALFPDAYLEGVLAEIRANYRVEAKRIYVTGLSMGGEATYRLAVHQPETFAAIAPLSAFAEAETVSTIGRIKALPVWAIHGADDTSIPVAKAQQPVDALKAAGGNVKFTVLEGHDHDVWTDTYSDSKFYDWLLQHEKTLP